MGASKYINENVVTEYISRSWEIYKKNAVNFIVAEALTSLIVVIILFLGVGFTFRSMGISLMNLLGPEIFSAGLAEWTKTLPTPSLGDLGVGIIFFITAILVSVALKTGIYGMAFESTKRRTKVETMFKVARKRGLTGAFAMILVAVIAAIMGGVLIGGLGVLLPIAGMVVGVMLILLAMVLFSLVFPAIVVGRQGAVKAIKSSVRITKKNYLEIFSLLLLYVIASLAVTSINIGLPMLGTLIQIFLIVPMMTISLTLFYLKRK